jgi:hypothetical protein
MCGHGYGITAHPYIYLIWMKDTAVASSSMLLKDIIKLTNKNNVKEQERCIRNLITSSLAGAVPVVFWQAV